MLVDTHADVGPRNELGHGATRQDAIVGSRVGFLPGPSRSTSAGPDRTNIYPLQQ
jgi:hypothetical protein